MNTFGVVLFHTTSSALRAEKIVARAGLVSKLIPTPRQFSSDCGFALRFEWSAHAQVQTLLDEARVEQAGIRPLA